MKKKTRKKFEDITDKFFAYFIFVVSVFIIFLFGYHVGVNKMTINFLNVMIVLTILCFGLITIFLSASILESEMFGDDL